MTFASAREAMRSFAMLARRVEPAFQATVLALGFIGIDFRHFFQLLHLEFLASDFPVLGKSKTKTLADVGISTSTAKNVAGGPNVNGL